MIPVLDIRTIMFIGVLMFLVICIFIFISSYKKNYKGIKLWNIGNILITSGIIIFVLQEMIAPYSSILISNILLLGGYSLLSLVLLLFLDIKPAMRLYWILNMAHCCLMAFFIYIAFNTGSRILINSSAYMIVIAYTIVKIFGNIELRRNRTYLFVLITYIIVFLNYLLKIITAMVNPSIHSVLDENVMMSIHFVILLISYFVFTMNLYDILVKRYEHELKVKSTSQLMRKKDELVAVIESISDAVFVFDINDQCYIQNKAAKDYFPNVELNGPGGAMDLCYCNMEGIELTSDQMAIPKVMQGQVVHNERIKVIHGDVVRYLNISGAPIYDQEGKKLLSIIYGQDITEDIHKQKLIEQQKELLESIINNMSECLYIYDKDENCILKNSAADRYSRKVKRAADNYKPAMYFDMDGNEVPLDCIPSKRVLRGEEVKNYILCIHEANETEYLDISGVPLYDENGDLKMGLVYMHDVTELIQKQNKINEQNERIIQIEKEKNETLKAVMKMKDEFLYLITHEFKTPINVISSALQTLDLVCKEELSPRANRFLNTINKNNKRQLRLVNNLLDITRINAGHIKLNRSNYDIVYLTKAIVDSVQVYGQQKDIDIGFSSTLSKKEIYIDDEKYERILLNLLSNALKFTLRGKAVNVILKEKAHENKNMISISVVDEGIGIPKEKQGHIFEQFGQADTSLSRKAEGCGIGLYLVKLLVDAHEGIIMLESEEGKGCDFTILLPNVKAEPWDEYALATTVDERLIQAVTIEFSDIYF